MTPLTERIEHAASLAKREMEAVYENSRERLIDEEVKSLRTSVATLSFSWLDPKNRSYITANRELLVEYRDYLSRLIEKIDAQAPSIQAAE